MQRLEGSGCDPGFEPGRLDRSAARGFRRHLHDDHGLAAQGRTFLLFARREEGVEIEGHWTTFSAVDAFIVRSIRSGVRDDKPDYAAALRLPPR
jgi:hypothetical protein